MSDKVLQVGLIGCGDAAQAIHIPSLVLLSRLFRIKTVCDVSRKTAEYCASKFGVERATTDAFDIFNDDDIDVVFVLTSDELHAPFAIAGLQAGKHIFVEKPMTLSVQTAEKIVEAEKDAPNGARVFVGYVRRYAPSLDTFKREISDLGPIRYARVRDIIGASTNFAGEASAGSQKYNDDIPAKADRDRKTRLEALLEEAWGIPFEELGTDKREYCIGLSRIGTHSLSLMRELFGGLPKNVLANAVRGRWYTAMFDYCNRGDAYTVVYETGIDKVPRFDSEIAVFGDTKTVTIRYDASFHEGLGTVIEVDELNDHGEKCHRLLQKPHQDAYKAELEELYRCVVDGKEIKTGAADALEDLELFKMMMNEYPEPDQRSLEGDEKEQDDRKIEGNDTGSEKADGKDAEEKESPLEVKEGDETEESGDRESGDKIDLKEDVNYKRAGSSEREEQEGNNQPEGKDELVDDQEADERQPDQQIPDDEKADEQDQGKKEQDSEAQDTEEQNKEDTASQSLPSGPQSFVKVEHGDETSESEVRK